ncbi:MAG: tetratricopeptide repeat protein [Pirellulales bacterium]
MGRRSKRSGKRRQAALPSRNIPSDVARRRDVPRRVTAGGTRSPRSDRTQAQFQRGIDAINSGQVGLAEATFRAALKELPGSAVAHNCLGIALKAAGRREEAIACYQRAVALDPRLAEAHNNLGNAWRDGGDIERALEAYAQALVIRPNFADAHNNRGVALAALGKIDEAIGCYRYALQLKGDYFQAHNNLANGLKEQGQFSDALASYRQALKLRADVAEVHHNLGTVCREMGASRQAVACYQQALRLKPDFVEAHEHLGGAWMDLGEVEVAIASYQQAVRLQPDSVRARNCLGDALVTQQRHEEAVRCYQSVTAIEPRQLLWQLRIASLCPTIFESAEAADRFPQQFLDRARELAGRKWEFTSKMVTTDFSKPSFNLQFLAGNVRELKEAYANIFLNVFPQHAPIGSEGKPRIGLLVTRGHEGIFYKSMAGILQRLSTDRFDTEVLCSHAGARRLREEIRNPSIQIVPLPERFDQMAHAIRHRRLDVLYFWEVGTDTTNYFLPFLRLAPVQCTGWGYQTTSGIPHIDYYLSSRLVETEESDDHYSEQLIQAETLLTYQHPPRLLAGQSPRAAWGLSDRQHVYLCAQHLGKLHPDIDPLLRSILQRDARGVVVITRDRYGYAARRLVERFERTLPDVLPRVVFLPRLQPADYHRLIAAADVVIDPPHFSGANSTYDAMAIGKPVVTLPTPFRRGRFTLGCYQKMGLMDCVAEDGEDYVERAVRLAIDVDWRHKIETEIRQRCSVLFEDPRAVREVERIFDQLIAVARSRSPHPAA